MKIEIKNRFNGEAIFSHECENNTIAITITEALKSYADLRSANLSSAKTDKKYCSINCIGSAKRMTTYCFEDDVIWCGCFKGSLKEFTARVKETHANSPQYLKEYLNFIKYLKSIK